MPPRLRWPPWKLARYGLAPATSAICLLLGLGFYSEFKPIPFMPFVPAIAICAGFGGLGPGLVAFAFSAAGATYLFLLDDFADSHIAKLAFFMASAAAITVLSTLLRNAYGAASAAREAAGMDHDSDAQLRRTVAELTVAYQAERKARLEVEAALAAALAKCAECPASDEGLAEPLTTRELEVLSLVADGLTNAETARRLVISPYTVNMHLRSVYSKLGVASRSAAVRAALDHKLI